MKRLGLLATTMMLGMLMLLGIGAASASEAMVDTPQGVKTLIEQAYPTHQIEGIWGAGDEAEGRFALSLSDAGEEGKEVILCLVEKSQSDSAYALTIGGGSTLPMHRAPIEVALSQNELVISTNVDYIVDMPIVERYVMNKDERGVWTLTSGSNTEVQIYNNMDGTQVYKQVVIELSIKDGMLEYVETMDGEQRHYVPVPYGEAFEKYLLLSNFDGTFPLTPYAFNNGGFDALIDTPLVTQGEELKQADLQVDELILIVELADGTQQLRFCTWDKAAKTYYAENCKPTAIELSLDTFHFGDGYLALHQDTEINGETHHYFYRNAQGKWRLSSIEGLGNIRLGLNYATEPTADTNVYKNDGYLYGEPSWEADIFRINFDALPTKAEVLAQLDQSNYALVSNPTPDTRLNIRANPTSDAATLGKLYSRTPVYVKKIMGDWVHIAVGSEDGLDGYVMKKFLAFGDEKEAVKCAFEELELKPEIKEQSIFAKPNEKAEVIGETSHYDHFIIGVYGDGWYIVLTHEGMVGYVPQASYWAGYAGNG